MWKGKDFDRKAVFTKLRPRYDRYGRRPMQHMSTQDELDADLDPVFT